jgi:hypothetical protein
MNRREFIAGVAGAAAWPVVAHGRLVISMVRDAHMLGARRSHTVLLFILESYLVSNIYAGYVPW